jgi:hypothetical protein
MDRWALIIFTSLLSVPVGMILSEYVLSADARLTRQLRKAAKNTDRDGIKLVIDYAGGEQYYYVVGKSEEKFGLAKKAAAYLKHERKSAELRKVRSERF